MNPDSLRALRRVLEMGNQYALADIGEKDDRITEALGSLDAHADQWTADNYAHAVEIAAKDVLIADLRDALRWMVNVANDVGKSGGKPYTDEWKDATDAGMATLAGQKE